MLLNSAGLCPGFEKQKLRFFFLPTDNLQFAEKSIFVYAQFCSKIGTDKEIGTTGSKEI